MGERILIVEDNELIAAMWAKPLRKAGYKVKTIFRASTEDDPGRGIIETQTFDPNLIISGIIMPGQNGFDFCKSLRDLNILTPVIFLDNYIKKDVQEETKKVGAQAFYSSSKISPNELPAIVKDFI